MLRRLRRIGTVPDGNLAATEKGAERKVMLAAEDFEFIRELLQKRSAIALDEEKHYFVESRLGPLARGEGYDSVGQLVARLRSGPANRLDQQVVEALMIHETSFFRDRRPFEVFRKKILPELIQARRSLRQIRILCMACSSGQEPYSLAMMIRDNFRELRTWELMIIATDLSQQVLEKARAGAYNQLEINRGLPKPYLLKFFNRRGDAWKLSDDVRQMVDFRAMNLIEPWPAFPPVDIVLFRNVLIYFDVAARKKILAKVRTILQPDGYLLLGAAESTLNLDDAFQRVDLGSTSIYRLQSTH